jgi:hypothetical protein
MTDPRASISQLERGIRRWRRAAFLLASALTIVLLCFGWLVVRSQIRAEQEKAEAERFHQEAVQAREEAEARRAFLERELIQKAK